MYEYKTTLLRVIDGDTIDVSVDLGFWVQHQRTLRFRGINAPELHDKDAETRIRAQNAKAYLMANIPTIAGGFMVKTYRDRTDKYGRMLADVYVGDRLINQELVEKGLAVPYMTGE